MISLIHDDSVNLADLQNKIIEIQDYLNTRKNDIIDNMVSLNIENYTIDDNQYYKKTKRYDYSIDTLDTQKMRSAALVIVPAVSTISSTSTTSMPSTSPMTSIESTSLARLRVLLQITMGPVGGISR